ncbi:MAG: hypothetical protein KAU14_03710 [Thermoplasmata archaeon]|nr:hypothetical protein [Thermoplasmata archaeon]
MNENGNTLNPVNIDTDRDTMNDTYEIRYGLNPSDGDLDTDYDGLINRVECNLGDQEDNTLTMRLDPPHPRPPLH